MVFYYVLHKHLKRKAFLFCTSTEIKIAREAYR